MKYLPLLVFSLITGVAHAAASLAGFVNINPDGTARVYFLQPPPAALPIWIQSPDTSGRLHCCVRIDRNALKKIEEKPAPEDVQVMDAGAGNASIASYQITSRLPALASAPDTAYTGLAVAAERATSDAPYRMRAQTGGKTMTIEACFGAEGENLIGREGKEYQRMYMGFGYDIDEKPKCTARQNRMLEVRVP